MKYMVFLSNSNFKLFDGQMSHFWVLGLKHTIQLSSDLANCLKINMVIRDYNETKVI